MHFVLLFAGLSLAVTAHRASYEGFKVYQLVPSNQQQLNFLDTLRENDEYDFWSQGRGINTPVDAMISPHSKDEFERLLQENNIEYNMLIEDVARTVENEKIAQLTAPKTAKGDITFTKYHRYETIQDYLQELQRRYPDIVQLHSTGNTVLGRDVTVVQISTNPQANKPILFIDAGIHAREWIAPAAALYVINQLVENEKERDLLNHFDWHIVPLINADGYEHSHSNERFWRKNRQQSGLFCMGVDLNRNFGEHWGGEGTSNNPCSEIYRGKAAFSEPEAQALRNYILSISHKTKLYLSFHSYGQYILHPWGYGDELPEDAPELKRLGDRVADSIKSVFNTTYQVGSVTQLLPAGAGGSDDWAKAKGGANIKYSYTFELPGGGRLGFDLPPSRIENVAIETFEGVRTFHDFLAKEAGY